MQNNGHSSTHHPHVEALRAKHAMLARRIEDAQKSPAINDRLLRQLKVDKLKLKDEILEHERRTG